MPDNVSLGFQDLATYQRQQAPKLAKELDDQIAQAVAAGDAGAAEQLRARKAALDRPGAVSAQAVRDYAAEQGWDQADVASAIVKLDGGDGAFDAHEFEALSQAFNQIQDRHFLDGLYQQVLGRNADPTGLAAWGPKVEELRQAGMSLDEIKTAMLPYLERSPENQINHADDFVQQAYQQALGREATADEVAGWKARMQAERLAGKSMPELQAGVVEEIQASPEAQARPKPPAAAQGVVPDSGLEGQHGGQCVVFVENQTGHHFPVEGAKQMLDPGMHPGYSVVGTPQPGDIFVRTGGEWGHTGIVKAVNPDGSLVVVDSNSNLDEIIHTRTVPAGYGNGYLRRDPSQATIPQN